jgi:hypothetical protein
LHHQVFYAPSSASSSFTDFSPTQTRADNEQF